MENWMVENNGTLPETSGSSEWKCDGDKKGGLASDSEGSNQLVVTCSPGCDCGYQAR